MREYAQGGYVTGGDHIPTMVHRGEVWISPASMKALAPDMLERLGINKDPEALEDDVRE